jgi:hypothetical protein
MVMAEYRFIVHFCTWFFTTRSGRIGKLPRTSTSARLVGGLTNTAYQRLLDRRERADLILLRIQRELEPSERKYRPRRTVVARSNLWRDRMLI